VRGREIGDLRKQCKTTRDACLSLALKSSRTRTAKPSTGGSNSAELAATGEVNVALRSKKPFALMRPPGHHATPTMAMVFCSFELDRDRNRCERDGIWDFDGY
jgi:acetoin utilization deacetylase AcuC-like enzyme